MRQHLRALFLLNAMAILPLAALPTRAADDKGWVQLFNGKDLTGWKLHPKPSGSIEEVITKMKDGKVIAFEGKLKDGKVVPLWRVAISLAKRTTTRTSSTASKPRSTTRATAANISAPNTAPISPPATRPRSTPPTAIRFAPAASTCPPSRKSSFWKRRTNPTSGLSRKSKRKATTSSSR
jgi:hypothetical protein